MWVKHVKRMYNRNYFEKQYKTLNPDIFIHQNIRSIILEFIKRKKPSSLLDVGCGKGDILLCINKYVKKCVGIDVSVDAIKLIHQHLVNKNNLRIIISNVENGIPLKDKSFDMILLIHVLEHLNKPKKILKKLKKLLNLNGTLLIIVPNCGKTYKKFFLKSNYGYNDETHKHFFDVDSLKEILDDVLNVDEIFTYPVPGLWKINPKFAKLLSYKYGNQIIVSCSSEKLK